jgi:pimeloyl-ACP methyl ester carboxylesterase
MPFSFRDVYCQSADGLKIHGAVWEPDHAAPGPLPVLCLPGLTRTTEDFREVAEALCGDAKAPRRVVAIDYRGRGLSDYDPDPANYAVPVEMGDVLAVAASLGISRAIVLGTSRGGIIAMVMAAAHPDVLAGVVLNDVGPALEMDGLMKIKGYIGNPPPRKTWDEAARGLKDLFGDVFPSLTDDGWMAWAHRAFKPAGDGLERTYDSSLAIAFDSIDPNKPPPPPAWGLFDKFVGIPLMLIHGALSDLLSQQGVDDMMARRPDIDLVTVADQGHAPLLADAPTIARIAAFCSRCDQGEALRATG